MFNCIVRLLGCRQVLLDANCLQACHAPITPALFVCCQLAGKPTISDKVVTVQVMHSLFALRLQYFMMHTTVVPARYAASLPQL